MLSRRRSLPLDRRFGKLRFFRLIEPGQDAELADLGLQELDALLQDAHFEIGSGGVGDHRLSTVVRVAE